MEKARKGLAKGRRWRRPTVVAGLVPREESISPGEYKMGEQEFIDESYLLLYIYKLILNLIISPFYYLRN